MTMNFPPGTRFLPTDLGLVRRYLRDKVESNESGFIKTMNVYGDAPWRLDHDPNPLFKRNEWYYFVPRTRRGGGNTVKRSVPRNGESEGGTWKSTGVKKVIVDGNNNLMGYKRKLVFTKNVKGKPDPVKPRWHMTEYSLHKDDAEFQDLVLCRIREKKDETLDLVLELNNTVLPNQERGEVHIGDLISF